MVVDDASDIGGGSRVQLPDGSLMKAKELSGKNGILFRRDSQSGTLHAIPRNKSWGELNAELHKNWFDSARKNGVPLSQARRFFAG